MESNRPSHTTPDLGREGFEPPTPYGRDLQSRAVQPVSAAYPYSLCLPIPPRERLCTTFCQFHLTCSTCCSNRPRTYNLRVNGALLCLLELSSNTESEGLEPSCRYRRLWLATRPITNSRNSPCGRRRARSPVPEDTMFSRHVAAPSAAASPSMQGAKESNLN